MLRSELKAKYSFSIFNAAFFRNGLLLLFPGIFTSLVIVFLSSGSWCCIEKPMVLKVLQLIQFQMLGLTLCKFGVDQTGFAILQNWNKSRLQFKTIAVYRVIPLALIYCFIISLFVGLWPAITLFFTLFLEVYCIVVIAELNVNEKFKKVSYIMMAGYPVLFIILIIFSLLSYISIPVVCITIFLSSFLKAFLSYNFRIESSNYIQPPLNFGIVLQQLLNYVLFRSDQLLIFSILFSSTIFSDRTLGINSLVYLTKYPELTNGILTAVWVLYLPILTPDFIASISLFLRKHCLFVGALVIAIIVTGIYHYCFGQFSYTHPVLIYLCFFFNAALGVPANMVTFHLLKAGKVYNIIRLSFLALSSGTALFMFSLYHHNPWIFIWIVPLQLILYITIFLLWMRKPV